MALSLPIVFIVGLVVLVAGYAAGYLAGLRQMQEDIFQELDKIAEEDEHSPFPVTSQQSGQSGTRTQERGSESTE